MVVVDRQHASFGVRAPGRLLERFGQRRWVVVSEHPERRLAERSQPLVGQLHPALQAGQHQLSSRSSTRTVVDPLIELARLRPPRVVAEVGDQALDVLEL